MTLRLLLAPLLCVLAFSALGLAQVCPGADTPDPLYQDTNGDGIDGDSSHAIFVSATAGNDANPGTMSQPVQTIAQAVSLASASFPYRDVYLAAGTYNPDTTIVLPPGVSLYGQFDGPPTWQRAGGNTVVINGGNPVISVNASGVEMHIEGLEIHAANAVGAGKSSYGVIVTFCAAPIYVRYNVIFAGTGAAGTTGVNGTTGANGLNGFNGAPAICGSTAGGGGAGGSSTCLTAGGFGGAGAPIGSNSGFGGGNGSGPGLGGTGGFGGAPGGVFCSAAGNGGNGANGSFGADGTNGSGAASLGGLTVLEYIPASGGNATGGVSGKGGGGGGGGGGKGGFPCTATGGNGGGGGGAGGCGATAGSGGMGGGGSFGVWSASSNTVIVGNTITTAAGGSGGNGGAGAAGGTGGVGGFGASNCSGDAGAGGAGGAGGNGGRSGAGAGGTGGPSIGIVTFGAVAASAASNSFTIAAGGSGGSGGISFLGAAPNGSGGLAQNTYGTFDPVVYPTPWACLSDVVVTEATSGTVNATFTLYLSSPLPTQVDVAYTTEDSTAVSGSDYVATSGTASFLAGQLMKQVTVPVDADVFNEPDEVFHLRLLSATGADIADSIGRGVIITAPTVTNAYPVNIRWNLVSLPVSVIDGAVTTQFPGASSSAYAFDPVTLYSTVDTLEPGPGYWLKFPAADLVSMTGFPSSLDTIPVKKGWNIIGSVTDTVPTAGVEAIPPGIIISPYFGYEGGYVVQSDIVPSKGYWVKASDPGVIVLQVPAAAAASRTVIAGAAPRELNSLTFSGPAGERQTLYFGNGSQSIADRAEFTLPPVPPAGAFDARFEGDRAAVVAEPGNVREIPLRVASASFPVRVTWSLREDVPGATLRVGNRSYDLLRDGEATIASASQPVVLMLSGRPEIPTEIALGQNYPNPFNPTTSIPYSLPASGRVRLTIVNLLGAEVAKLVDEEKAAGYHQVVWDAASVPSGIYFYRLETGTFREIKKLVLLR